MKVAGTYCQRAVMPTVHVDVLSLFKKILLSVLKYKMF
jgi:hypothetical protein